MTLTVGSGASLGAAVRFCAPIGRPSGGFSYGSVFGRTERRHWELHLMRTGTTARSIAVAGAALLAVAACGGSDSGGGDNASDSGEKQVNIYGTDGNMGNALGEDFKDKGALAGMKGTTPLTKLSGDF